jgi:hypothetical protein
MSGEELRCSSIDQEIGDSMMIEGEFKSLIYTQFTLITSQAIVGVLIEFRRKLICFNISGEAS